ncbi:hypothetical protein ACTMTI_01390 [Nonomuraea sp. H19]|uniref:hypothetical protein n=1 Tax=Nonomuraea sp. H19 TaxID=3452206 RepID=UPI003F8B33C2
MADLDIHLSVLDKCRTALHKATSQYEDTLEERNPGELSYDDDGQALNNRPPISPDIFGHLKDSGTLAVAAQAVWSALISEMDEARKKLAGTERGLSNVEENIRRSNRATS